jgi:hypothetical protein
VREQQTHAPKQHRFLSPRKLFRDMIACFVVLKRRQRAAAVRATFLRMLFIKALRALLADSRGGLGGRHCGAASAKRYSRTTMLMQMKSTTNTATMTVMYCSFRLPTGTKLVAISCLSSNGLPFPDAGRVVKLSVVVLSIVLGLSEYCDLTTLTKSFARLWSI